MFQFLTLVFVPCSCRPGFDIPRSTGRKPMKLGLAVAHPYHDRNSECDNQETATTCRPSRTSSGRRLCSFDILRWHWHVRGSSLTLSGLKAATRPYVIRLQTHLTHPRAYRLGRRSGYRLSASARRLFCRGTMMRFRRSRLLPSRSRRGQLCRIKCTRMI